MKKVLPIISTVFFLLIVSPTGFSQLINWQTGNGDPCAGTGNGTMDATSDAACITVISLCRGGGLNQATGGDFNSNSFNTSNTSCAEAITDDDCLTWGFDLGNGCSVAENSIVEFQLDRSNTGPTNYCLDMDSGSGFSNISSGAISASTGCVSASIGSAINGPTTVMFRLCAWGAAGSTGTMDIEDGTTTCGGDTDSGISLTEPVPLPINLASFTAKAMHAHTVELKWNTASEENNDYFGVEYSTNGHDFTELGRVDGVGTTFEAQDYHFMHKDVAEGANYYRLRQVNLNGTFAFSPVKVVELFNDAEIAVRPTFAGNTLDVSVNFNLYRAAKLDVIDIMGRSVIQEAIGTGAETLQLDVSNLQQGHYFVRLQIGNEIKVTRFVKI